MATVDEAVRPLELVRLSDLQDGQEAECFAALVSKTPRKTYKGETFLTCIFRDRRGTIEAPIWPDNKFLQQASSWAEGQAYRLHVRAAVKPKYGLQLEIFNIRPAGPEDVADGYDFYELVESAKWPEDVLRRKLDECLRRNVTDPYVFRLVESILEEHGELIGRMPAAQSFHHAYTGGLLEHVWSMTRISSFLADHYAKYYDDLNPPLNRSVIVAAAVLHDIGKIRELAYSPVEAKYTKEGRLLGHTLMGRDMVRAAAAKIPDFPEETLLLLEHAILAHHGKQEFGAPIVPQTLEALVVSFVDDLDAKFNAAARARLNDQRDGEFTDRVRPLDGRMFYKGIPVEAPEELDGPPGC